MLHSAIFWIFRGPTTVDPSDDFGVPERGLWFRFRVSSVYRACEVGLAVQQVYLREALMSDRACLRASRTRCC